MAKRGRLGSRGRAHRFGGDWTQTKLDILAGYLRAYTTALKNQAFSKVYIDAFAGTGYRSAKTPDLRDDAGTTIGLFPEEEGVAEEQDSLVAGSAAIALGTEPSFDRYVFIEQDTKRCRHLERLRNDFPERAAAIDIREGDANEEVRKLCRSDWKGRRGVLFLDPYGMNVEWATLQAIAETQAIDLWLLFPLGIGVNRLLTKSGEIPPEWSACLDRLFGTHDWLEAFYSRERQLGLFGESGVTKDADFASIGRFFNERLESIFPAVAQEPGVLRNSSNNPLYLLCFAVSNPEKKAIAPALRIANHLLKPHR
jgi:three-Cys-motif partner protein